MWDGWLLCVCVGVFVCVCCWFCFNVCDLFVNVLSCVVWFACVFCCVCLSVWLVFNVCALCVAYCVML